MKQRHTLLVVFIGLVVSVVAALALAAQDKYTLKVPGGNSHSLSSEDMNMVKTISVSRRDIAAILQIA